MDQGDRVNILLVDDQPAKLMSYEVILQDLGENLLKATSGREALEYLLKTEVAIVLGSAVQYQIAEVVDPLVHVVARIDKKALANYGALALASYRKNQWFGIPGSAWMATTVRWTWKVKIMVQLETEIEQLDEALHDAQAQAITITRTVGGDAHLIELIINVRDLIRWNADPRVEHLDANPRVLM